MPISDTEKIDFLLKKVGYELAKTAGSTLKTPDNETIPSPITISSQNLWLDTVPTDRTLASASIVQPFFISLSGDSTAPTNRTWVTTSSLGGDWISKAYGNYGLRVWVAQASPQQTVSSIIASGTEIQPAGTNNDGYLIDYTAGVINFSDTNVPSSLTAIAAGNRAIYVSGYKYVGSKGTTAGSGIARQSLNLTQFPTTSASGLRSIINGVSGFGSLVFQSGANLINPSINGSDFTAVVSGIIDQAVSTSIVAGSGISIVYNSDNTLSISSPITAGPGISVSLGSSGTYQISATSTSTSTITDFEEKVEDQVNSLLKAPPESGIVLNYIDPLGETGGGTLNIGVNKLALGLNNVQNLALSGINITAGSGLVGGGSIDSSRTLNVGAGDGITVSADNIAVDSTIVRTTGDQDISGNKSLTGTTNFYLDLGNAPLNSFSVHRGTSQGTMSTIRLIPSGTNYGAIANIISANSGIEQNLFLPTTNGTLALLSDINTSQITGILPVSKGGTGRTSISNGQLLIGSGTSFAANTLTPVSGIGINSGSGTISIGVTGIPSSSITNFNSSVSGLVDGLYVPVTRTITPGNGLVGTSGLDLSTNRTLDVGAGDGITVSANAVAVDSSVVRTSGTQTISGRKVFQDTPVFGGLSFDSTGGYLPLGVSIGFPFGDSNNIGPNDLSIGWNPDGAFDNEPYNKLFAGSGGVGVFNFNYGNGQGRKLIFDVPIGANTANTTLRTAESANGDCVLIIPHVVGTGTLATISNINASQLAGVLSIAKGGTGRTTINNGQLLIGSGNNFAANTLTAGTGISITSGSGTISINVDNTVIRTTGNQTIDGQLIITSGLNLNNSKITNLATPTQESDAATKSYVDAARSGLDVKQSVRVATTTSLLTLFGLLTIDGQTLVAGDRVLVKDQTGPQQTANGIWVASAGTWSRATDADSSEKVTAGMFTFVTEGDVNGDSGWVLTTNDTITLNFTPLTFAQFSGAGQITPGSGLTKSGNTLQLATAYGDTVNPYSSKNANTVLAAPTGSSGAPSFRNLVPTDIPGTINSLVVNNAGAGTASPFTFNGNTAQTLSYNSIGAPSISGVNAVGIWNISITGNAGSVTNGVYTTNKLNALSLTSSAELAEIISDETGSGNLVFSTNPQFTNSITTNSSSFDLFNTTATSINAFGSASLLNIGIAGFNNNSTTTNIATGTMSSGNVKTINIGGNVGSTATGVINIGTGGAASASTTIINSAIFNASWLVTPSSGVINIGSNNTLGGSSRDINLGAGGSASTANINIGTNVTGGGTANINIGTSGAGSTTVNNNVTLNGTLSSRALPSSSAATQIPVFTADPSGTTRSVVTRTPAQLLTDIGAAASNQTMFIGTTNVAINRSSASLALSGVSIDGNAGSASLINIATTSSNINNLVVVNGTTGNLSSLVNNNLRFDASNNILIGASGTSSDRSPITKLEYFIIDGGTP